MQKKLFFFIFLTTISSAHEIPSIYELALKACSVVVTKKLQEKKLSLEECISYVESLKNHVGDLVEPDHDNLYTKNYRTTILEQFAKDNNPRLITLCRFNENRARIHGITDNGTVIASCEHMILLYNANTKEKKKLKNHFIIQHMVLAQDQLTLICSRENQDSYQHSLWNIRNMTRIELGDLWSGKDIYSVASNGSVVAGLAATVDQEKAYTDLLIGNLTQKDDTRRVKNISIVDYETPDSHRSFFINLLVTTDGKKVITSSQDKSVIFDVQSGAPTLEITHAIHDDDTAVFELADDDEHLIVKIISDRQPNRLFAYILTSGRLCRYAYSDGDIAFGKNLNSLVVEADKRDHSLLLEHNGTTKEFFNYSSADHINITPDQTFIITGSTRAASWSKFLEVSVFDMSKPGKSIYNGLLGHYKKSNKLIVKNGLVAYGNDICRFQNWLDIIKEQRNLCNEQAIDSFE